MYLVSVYFDEKTNRILRKHIDRISAVSGNHFMTDNHVPPHMTILALEARSSSELIPSFEKLKGKIEGCSVNFVTVGQLFPYVIYAAPVLDDHLRELSEKAYTCFEGLEGVSASRYYMPGSWLPHVTLGKTLDRQQMRLAFEAMQENFVPFSGRISQVGLASVNPHADIERFEL